MSKLELTTLYVANLTNTNAFPLFKTTIELAIPYKSDLGVIENAALTQLTADNEAFGKQVGKNQRSEFTDDLKLFEKERISFWKEIVRITNSYIKSADSEKKAAAQTVDFFIRPYKGIPDLPLNSKTGIIGEVIGKYKVNASLIAAAKLLGIDSSFSTLEIKNNCYDRGYKSRNNESASRELSGSALKPIAVASYNQFCTAIEQAVNLTPSESILTLFNKLNELRKKYHALGGGSKDTPSAPAGEK